MLLKGINCLDGFSLDGWLSSSRSGLAAKLRPPKKLSLGLCIGRARLRCLNRLGLQGLLGEGHLAGVRVLLDQPSFLLAVTNLLVIAAGRLADLGPPDVLELPQQEGCTQPTSNGHVGQECCSACLKPGHPRLHRIGIRAKQAKDAALGVVIQEGGGEFLQALGRQEARRKAQDRLGLAWVKCLECRANASKLNPLQQWGQAHRSSG